MNKTLIVSGLAVVALFIVLICFGGEIQIWLMSKLNSMLILVISFVAGWLLGYFGRGRGKKSNEPEKL